MYLKRKLQLNKKRILFGLIVFLILLPYFFNFLSGQKEASGIFSLLISGTLLTDFFSYMYFPLICFGALFVFPNLSIYQLQKKYKVKYLIEFISHVSLHTVITISISNISAAIITSLFLNSKIIVNLRNELISLFLYILIQCWLFIIVFIIGLVKQVAKKKIIMVMSIILIITINITLMDFQVLSFSFSGISNLHENVNYMNLLFQIIEFPLFGIVVMELSEWILKITDY